MLTHGNMMARAVVFAERAHRGQERKDTGEPYFVHVAHVATIVAGVTDDETMIAAAYLHDTVEDCRITIEEIEGDFGTRVAYLVQDLTDVSRPADGNREKRKAIDRRHTALAHRDAKTIKLADLISNTSSIVQLDPDFAKVYMAEKRALLEVLKQGDPLLWGQAKAFVDFYFAGQEA